MSSLIIFTLLFSLSSAEKIIIIGAGPAGIGAASRLLNENITDFIILEAENRIGGRINSIQLGDAFVDLGAEYVHGEKGNLVFELARDYVIRVNQVDNVKVFYEGREKMEENLMEEFLELLESNSEGGSNISVGDAFLKSYNKTVLEKYKNKPESLEYAQNFIRSSECFMLSLEGAFSWFRPVARGSFQDCEGIQTINWSGLGYKKIFDILLKKFPNATSKISLNKTVTKLKLNENSTQITCSDGSEYVADHVIFTPSLGVLKNDHEKLFEPKLSDAKIEIIESLGFDGVMKVLFEFSETWWNVQENYVFVWNDQDKKDLIKDIPYGPIQGDDHWLSWFYSIGSAPNNTKVLIGWIVGPMVPEIEKLTEEQMTNGTLYVIKKFLGNDYNVTRPIKVIHSKWCTSPNFRGSYSYETVEGISKNISRNTLAEPIYDKNGVLRIQFAGEATNPTRSSTVDGAIGSGFRESDRLLSYL